MSHRIIFKGQIPDEFVEDTIGRSISEKWESGALSGRVSINGNLYEASSIKAILSGFQDPDKSDKQDENIKEMAKMKRDSDEYYRNKQKRPPEVRAQNTGLAEVVYTAHTGRPMPHDVKQQVIARQLAFFKENNHFAEAKPTCYKDLIPTRITTKNAAPSIGDLLAVNMLNFAERVVANGIQDRG